MYDIMCAAETRQMFYEHAVGALSRGYFLLFERLSGQEVSKPRQVSLSSKLALVINSRWFDDITNR